MISALSTTIYAGQASPRVNTPTRADDATPVSALTRRDQAKLAQGAEALDNLKKLDQTARDKQKAMARETINALKERLKLLKAMSPVDAKMMAQLVKELTKAVKAYLEAGGRSGDIGSANPSGQAGSSTPDAKPTPTAQDEKAVAESREITSFVDEVRDFVKKIREVMQLAKPDHKGSLEDANKELKEMERDLDKAASAAGPGAVISIKA